MLWIFYAVWFEITSIAIDIRISEKMKYEKKFQKNVHFSYESKESIELYGNLFPSRYDKMVVTV